MDQNYFKILEINNDATIEEVNQAYRDLAQIWHPDHVTTKNPWLKEKAEKKMKELNKARSKIIAYLAEKKERKTEKRSEWEEKKERERATREQAERERATRERTEATKKAEEEFFRKRAEQIAAEAKAKKNGNDDDDIRDCPRCGMENRIQKITVGFIQKCNKCGNIDYFKEKPICDETSRENRVLCSDESCIGVIRKDGRCKICGKKGDVELPKMNETSEKAKRPTLITVICVIGFIGGLFTFPDLVGGLAVIGAVIGFPCMVVLWMMRK